MEQMFLFALVAALLIWGLYKAAQELAYQAYSDGLEESKASMVFAIEEIDGQFIVSRMRDQKFLFKTKSLDDIPTEARELFPDVEFAVFITITSERYSSMYSDYVKALKEEGSASMYLFMEIPE